MVSCASVNLSVCLCVFRALKGNSLRYVRRRSHAWHALTLISKRSKNKVTGLSSVNYTLSLQVCYSGIVYNFSVQQFVVSTSTCACARARRLLEPRDECFCTGRRPPAGCMRRRLLPITYLAVHQTLPVSVHTGAPYRWPYITVFAYRNSTLALLFWRSMAPLQLHNARLQFRRSKSIRQLQIFVLAFHSSSSYSFFVSSYHFTISLVFCAAMSWSTWTPWQFFLFIIAHNNSSRLPICTFRLQNCMPHSILYI